MAKSEKTIHTALVCCEICGKEYAIAMTTRLTVKDPFEGRMKVRDGICDDCKGVFEKGGVMLIEVRDDDNEYRTGKVLGMSKEFREHYGIEPRSAVTVPQSKMKELLGDMYDYDPNADEDA